MTTLKGFVFTEDTISINEESGQFFRVRGVDGPFRGGRRIHGLMVGDSKKGTFIPFHSKKDAIVAFDYFKSSLKEREFDFLLGELMKGGYAKNQLIYKTL